MNGKTSHQCFQMLNQLLHCLLDATMEMECSAIQTLDQLFGAFSRMRTRTFQFILQQHMAEQKQRASLQHVKLFQQVKMVLISTRFVAERQQSC